MKALSKTHFYDHHLALYWAKDKKDIETLRGKAARNDHLAGKAPKNKKYVLVDLHEI